MTITIWWRAMKTSILWFILLSLLAFTLAAVAFSYVFDRYLSEGKVLGVQVQNSGGLSLFSSQARLVKSAQNPTVYAIVGGFKHPIRNEEVFYSYDYNFRNVRVVSAAELQRYPLARLAKERGTGRVYFLNYGNNLKKYHLTPQAFSSYPGNRWAEVVEVSGKDLSFWEDAALLKEASSAKIYYLRGNQKAWVPSENEFLNAGFSWGKILTVSQADLDTYQTVNFNIDLVRSSQETVAAATPSATKQVIVTLDASSPAASILPFATAGNLAAVFRFQALSGNVNISGLKLTKSGLLNINKITAARVEDENGAVFASNANISGNLINVNFRSPVVIPRALPKILRVKLSFAPGQETNHTVSLGIQAESDIQADATVSGIFPLFAATHKLIAADNLIGQVRISSQTINNTLRDVNLGSRNEAVARFTLEETSGNERAAVSSLTFTNYGTANDNDVENISLYRDRALIGAVRSLQNGKATFNLIDNNITVAKNSPVEVSLKIDILQGEGSTLKFVIDSADDIQVRGLTQGFNLVVASADNFPIGQGASDNYNKVAFRRAGVGFFASSLTDSEREIFRGQDNTIFAQFELRNAGQDIYLQRLKLQVEKFNGAPDIANDISLMEKISREVIVTVDKERTRGGVTADVNLGNHKIAANAAPIIWVVIKVPEDAQSNNSYRINIPELSYKIGLDNTTYTQAVAAMGQLMQVYAPRLTLTAGALVNSGAAIAGADAVELGGFSLAASVDEQIKITNIVMSLATSSDDVTYASGFAELALYSGNRVSGVISQPNSRTYTFSNLNITIRAGATLGLTIKADTENITAGKRVQFKLESMQAEGYSSHAPVSVAGEGTISDAVEINAASGG